MKAMLWIAAALIVFIAVMLVPAAIKGELSLDSIKRIAGIEEPAPPPGPNENLGPLAQKLKDEQARLAEWQKELDEREARLDQREQLLDQTLAEITETKEDVMEAMQQLDQEQLTAITEYAKTLEKMDPKNAAADIEAMSPEEAARILPLIKSSSRGKILDEVEASVRSDIQDIIMAKKY